MTLSTVTLQARAARAPAAVAAGVKSAGQWLYENPLVIVPALAGGAVSWLYERFYSVIVECERVGGWPPGACSAPSLPPGTLQRGPASAAELATRLTWSASGLLLATVALGAVVLGAVVVLRAARGRPGTGLGLLVAGALAGLIGMGHFAERARHFIVFRELLDNPALYSSDERAFVVSMAGGMRGLTLFAACILSAAACATLLPPRGREHAAQARQLKLQMGRLNLVLYMGAGLLVAGVLEFSALQAWGLARLTDASAKLYAPATSAAVAAIAGVSFLVLVALYVPALLLLHMRGEDLFDHIRQTETKITREDWLEANGLAVTLPTYVTRFAAVLAPLLAAGPFSAVMKILLGS